MWNVDPSSLSKGQLRRRLREAVEELCEKLEDRCSEGSLNTDLAAFHDFGRQVGECAAQALGPAINERMARIVSGGTFQDRRAAAVWLQQVLRELDLAIEGPDSKPAFVRVEPRPDNPLGRFQIELCENHERRSSSTTLPAFKYIPHKRQRDHKNRFTERVSAERSTQIATSDGTAFIPQRKDTGTSSRVGGEGDDDLRTQR